jgi:hypothetical protein
MTDQEKREQKIKLLVDLEEAQDDLAHLRENALRVADDLESAVRKIRENAVRQPSKADFSADQELAGRLTQQHRTAMDFDHATNLIEKLRAARQRVFQLDERRMQLSASSTTILLPRD